MIVRRFRDVEEQDVGSLLGIPDMGIRIKWLIHKGIGNDSYGHRFALRYFTIEPGKSYPMHHHEYVEAVFILSGRAIFESEREKFEVGEGDVIYTYSGEPHSLSNPGGVPLRTICCIDCLNGGENCIPQVQQKSVIIKKRS